MPRAVYAVRDGRLLVRIEEAESVIFVERKKSRQPMVGYRDFEDSADCLET
jgi:hypothetical protein